MGGTPNGLKQFFVQGRTTIKKHVFPNCLRSSSIMEGEMDFHAWVGSKIYSWMFFVCYDINSFRKMKGRCINEIRQSSPFSVPVV